MFYSDQHHLFTNHVRRRKNRISKQCSDLNLLLNPTKTQEMMFSTQLVKPDTPALNLNGTDITLCDKMRYLGITVDNKLRFQEQVQSVLTIALIPKLQDCMIS